MKGMFQIKSIRDEALRRRIALITFILQYVNTIPFISTESKTEFKELMKESYNANEALSDAESEMYEERIGALEKKVEDLEKLLQSLDVNNI